ncbi:MAG: hypothetical protein U9R75_02000, partial [Candidatus Thermoplasmatota archaeon]|nr:hypothetical protein [Candidatus Thermoplasmatota archaeon]
KTALGLSFLSTGISKEVPGLLVKFTSIPLRPIFEDYRDHPVISGLLEYDEPLVLDLNDPSMMDILTSLMSSGEIGNLVLDHPDILSHKGDPNWFKMLEETASSARENGIRMIILNYPGSIGPFVSEGVLDLSIDEDRRRSIEVVKWDWDRSFKGSSIRETEVGEWGI